LAILGYFIQRYSIEYIIDSPHSAQIILTFGLLLVFQNVLLFFFKSDLRGITGSYLANTIQVGPARVLVTRVIAFFISITIMLILYVLLKKTNIGRAIRAAAIEKEGAEAVGINFKKIYRISFALGTICAGIAGAASIPFLYASPTVGFSFTVKSFIIVVLGGMGSFGGAMIGGIILGLTESFGTLVTSGSLSQSIGFILLIVILLFRPQGLFGSRAK
jgi:branched-chain amino acid transport system permease protein